MPYHPGTPSQRAACRYAVIQPSGAGSHSPAPFFLPMYIKTLSIILLWAGLAQACVIPQTWTISTPDPCKTMRQLLISGALLDARFEFLHAPVKRTSLGDDAFRYLSVIGYQAPFSCTLGAGYAGTCTGFYSTDGQTSRIDYMVNLSEEETMQVLIHEVGHFIWNRRGLWNWQWLGHGNQQDPYVQFVNGMINFLWQKTDRYFPGYPPGVK